MTMEIIPVWKEQRVGGNAANVTAVGFEQTLWQWEGNPSHGAVPPTTFANPDNTTPGGLLQVNPSVGQKWLTSMLAGACQGGRLVLYDRLLHISGLSGTVTTAQTINGGSAATLSRHYQPAGGLVDDGNEIFLEVYTAVGATQVNATCSYTNSAGTSGRTTVATPFGGTTRNLAQKLVRLPLQAGDTGVQSVTSVTLSASTLIAGNFGLVVAHRLLEIECGSVFVPEVWSGVDGRFVEILPSACLAFSFLTGGASTGTATGLFAMLTCVDV
jgi:hypothetical protein